MQRALRTFPICAVKYPAPCSFFPIIVRFALHSVCDVMPRLPSWIPCPGILPVYTHMDFNVDRQLAPLMSGGDRANFAGRTKKLALVGLQNLYA